MTASTPIATASSTTGARRTARPRKEAAAAAIPPAGGPVQPATGVLVLGPYVDLTVRGAFSPHDDLVFERAHDSAYPIVPTTTPQTLASMADSGIGLGWGHSFGVRLEFRPDVLDGFDDVVFVREDGRSIQFEQAPAGTYTPAGGRGQTRLSRTNPGDPTDACVAWGATYTLREAGEVFYCFEADGRILRRQNRGHGTSFDYSAGPGAPRRLSCVRNDSNQAIVVEPSAAGSLVGRLLFGTSCTDPAAVPLVAFSYSGGLLASVQYPSSPSTSAWTFTYGGGTLADKVTAVHFGSAAAPILHERIEWEAGTDRVWKNFTPSSALEFQYADPSCAGTLVTDLAEDAAAERPSCITFDPATGLPLSSSGPCRCGDTTAQYGYTAASGGTVLSCTTDRQGTRTSLLFDVEGRLTARVENDNDCDALTAPAGAAQTFYFHGIPTARGR